MTKRYSSQFKQEALHFIQIHPSLGIATIAKQLDIGYSTILLLRALLDTRQDFN